MRLQLILFAVCILLVLGIGIPILTSTTPTDQANEFLRQLQTGSVPAVVDLFGDNTCSCPPKGGYVSYIKYESGLEPNLAFLLGKPFDYQILDEKKIAPKEHSIVPFDRPENAYVDVAITFKNYRPYFLPLDMAFGIPITESDLRKFCADPQANAARGFSLRLRPTLEPGLIGPPSLKVVRISPPKQPISKQKESEEEAAFAKYIFPKDAGSVTSASGQKLSPKEIAASLPQLSSALLRLEVARRGQMKPWQIAKFRFLKAAVTCQGRQIDLPVALPNQPPL
jgi:hypothetical protein